jgi:Na+-driven multidrug efflux pump
VVVSTTSLYLRIVPIGYGLYGVIVLTTAALNALNRPLHAATVSIGHRAVFYIPFALLGSHMYGLKGMFAGLMLSFLAGALVSRVLLARVLSVESRSS